MVKDAEEPVSFTDTNVEGAGNKEATGSAMMDLITGLRRKRGGGGSSKDTGSTSGSTGEEKRKKKKRKATKRKRRKDRYESQNYLLRIEGTLCCASLMVAAVFIIAIFIVFLICGVWSKFDFTATTDSVKDQ